MTIELFREDSYLKQCQATVQIAEGHLVILNQTVFYPMGGGQPGDSGKLLLEDGTELRVVDTQKDVDGRGIAHLLEENSPLPAVGSTVEALIDWERRYRHMRMHSCLHLLCSLIDGGVTGGSISETKSRLDFDLQDTTLDKQFLTEELNRLVAEDHSLSARWITEEEMTSQQDLVRTMSVKPPSDEGRVRLIEVEGVDLQACGGTHVSRTSEIGAEQIGKIENKGRHNRRVNIVFQ
ncbi:MAG: alanyl-tRNA editing protein [Pseudomonadales bacterium]|nr:alanyl-tRNA editing protein [Pseudomonadales bacterium]